MPHRWRLDSGASSFGSHCRRVEETESVANSRRCAIMVTQAPWNGHLDKSVVGSVASKRPGSEFVDCSVFAGEPQSNDVGWPID